MSNSKIYDYFCCDGFKIAINLLILIGIILFIIVICIAFAGKKSNFNLLFLMIINAIISGIFSALAYLLNWKVDVDYSPDKQLLFGDSDGFLCQAQSFMISYFQSTRETFCSLIIITVFLNYKKISKVENTRLLYKIIIQLLGYGIPFIANLIYSLLGVFGESHLFCFTKIYVNNTISICGTIHYIYIAILLSLSLGFTIYIIYKDCKDKNEDVWTNIDDNNKKKCFSDPQLKKIIFYPFAQILSNIFILYHRFSDFLIEDEIQHRNNVRSGPAAIVNTLSSILYNIIFILSNGLFSSDDKNKNLKLNDDEDEDDNNISLTAL